MKYYLIGAFVSVCVCLAPAMASAGCYCLADGSNSYKGCYPNDTTCYAQGGWCSATCNATKPRHKK